MALLKGPYDDELEQSGYWPLRGKFSITLFNQYSENDHYAPTDPSAIANQVDRIHTKGEISFIEVISKLISHDALFQRNSYLKDDSIHLRISFNKPWW